jgi:hypothetical protein
LRLSVIYRWQQILNVPVSDLLVQPDETLSAPIQRRAQLLQLMKTAKAIHRETKQPTVKRLAQRLVDQLVDMMPELEEIGAWHAVGQRRRTEEYGRITEQSIPEPQFRTHD